MSSTESLAMYANEEISTMEWRSRWATEMRVDVEIRRFDLESLRNLHNMQSTTSGLHGCRLLESSEDGYCVDSLNRLD